MNPFSSAKQPILSIPVKTSLLNAIIYEFLEEKTGRYASDTTLGGTNAREQHWFLRETKSTRKEHNRDDMLFLGSLWREKSIKISYTNYFKL